MRPPSDRSLEQLLAPISIPTFCAEHWVEKALHVPGSPAKLEALFGPVALEGLLRLCERGTAPPLRIQAFFPSRRSLASEADELPRIDAEPSAVRALLDAGATVSVRHLDAIEPTLARWLGAIRTGLQHAGRTTSALWL